MIHKFSMNGINVVMDVQSGSVHIVDSAVYDIIDDFENMTEREIIEKHSGKYSEDELREAASELNELKESGMLFTDVDYAGVLPVIKNREPVVKALCLHVAHDCNLKCKYCFAEEGEYHGKREIMSLGVGKAALDFLVKASGSRINLEVDFFGGEPLMNFDVVKELVHYGRSLEEEHNKNFRFTITTNGILLDDDKIDFINANMQNVVLSLDGRREVNDKMRPRAGGMGSYDAIVKKYQNFAARRGEQDYYLRGTFTKHNLDFSRDVLHMADLGFKNLSVEPVVAKPEEDYAITERELEDIYKEYERLALELNKLRAEGKDINFFHFNIDMSGGPCVIKRLSGCGSGTEYLAVTPSGDLYPCHQFVGLDGFKMGTVFDGIKNTDLRQEFLNCNVYTKKDCADCWAKFYCSGGCAANAYQYGGGILSSYKTGCELQKKRIECAIMLKAMELMEN